MSLKENLNTVKNTFINKDCLLVAVSKTKPNSDILEAYEAGVRDFGENKVQDLTDKQPELPKDINWHFIGHLQRNKVKYLASFIHLIHGVDSFKLLKEINKQAKNNERTIPCLLQIHIAKEENKFGFSEEELEEMLADPELQNLKNIKVTGLMGMATYSSNEEVVRHEFRGLKELFNKLQQQDLPDSFELKEISMGMSGDYLIAQEEGSTIVRIGSAIFGERN